MRVLFKPLSPKAVVPTKAYNGDLCYDVTAVSCEEIAPNVYKYGLGFALAIDREDGDIKTGEELFASPVCVEESSMSATTDKEITFTSVKPYLIKANCLNISIDLRARSSVWKHGMVLANSVGTIDEGYRGELAMIFYHVNTNLPKYEVGEAVGQMKVGFATPIEFNIVDELPPSERDINGFGSSDKKRKEAQHG